MTSSDELRKRREKEAVRIRTSLNRLRGEQRASIKGGETMIITAVGAGLAWGAAAIKLGQRVTPLGETDAALQEFDGTGIDAIQESIDYFVHGKKETQ